MGKIQLSTLNIQGITLSTPTPHDEAHEPDAVERVVSAMPLVLPLAGAVENKIELRVVRRGAKARQVGDGV